MTDFLTDKTVKTRKPHRCWGCGRTFPAGTELTLIEAVDFGDWYSSYWCPVCERVMFINGENEGFSFGELRNNDLWEKTRADMEGDAV